MDVHVTGGLMVAETAEELRLLHDKQQIEARAGLETHVLTGRELREFAPYLAEDLAGATFCPEEGHVNPLLAAPLFALRALEHGARVRVHTPVTAIERLGARGFLVSTPAGTVRARRIVDAAGAWADEVAGMVGLRLPIRREGLHVNVTEPRPHVLRPLVQHIGRRLTLKQSSNDTFIIGGGWPSRREARPARYSIRWDSAAGNAAVAIRVVPMLAGVRLVRTWSGVMAFTDDLTPVVGEAVSVPGFHTLIATTGFTLSPLLAQRLAGAMTGGPPMPAEFSPERGERSTMAS
jgi:glycine/D-amino acid oxidase-like deaminating enzyme